MLPPLSGLALGTPTAAGNDDDDSDAEHEHERLDERAHRKFPTLVPAPESISSMLRRGFSMVGRSGGEPSPASRLDGSLWESLCCFWGCPADASRSDAFAVSGCVRVVSLDAPAVRLRSVPRN